MSSLLPGMLGCALLLAPVPPCQAHEDTQTHSRLSVGAILFLDQAFPQDGALFSPTARARIVEGSIREDDSPNYVNHFFNPKTGAALNAFVDTAPKRASDFWQSAVQRYRSGDRNGAASDIGHVLHLMQDMTSPAHVHIDNHGQIFLGHCEGDGDDFEVWGYCTDYNFNAILQYVTSTDVTTSTLLPPLTIGLQTIFDNQPQRASKASGDINTGYTFVRGLANAVYDFTTFYVVLKDTPSLENDHGSGELKTMFPSLVEDGTGWRINNIGWSAGDCQNIQNQDWWMMNDSDCHNDGCGFLCKRVSGYAYIENTGGGDGDSFEIPDNLKPTQYDRQWFRRRYGSASNTNSMLRIYGDVLYPAAVAYGAGLLQALLDEVIMPRPITGKPSQLTGIGAQLNGQVLPRGEPAVAWFEWGTDTNYGMATPMQPAGAGQVLTNLSAAIRLSAGTLYYCRIVSSNRFGVRQGTNQTFRTPSLLVTGDAPNAWQITDRSTSSFLNYSTNLNATLQQAATNGWRYSVNARMVETFGGNTAMNFFYQASANRRFLVWWDLDSEGDLTAEIEGQDPRTVATNGLGSTLYHTHEIRYTNGAATYLFDGSVIGTWTGAAVSLHPAGHVSWGSGSSAGMGQMNFHNVEFEIVGQGVAAYRAGTANNPPAAPNPVTQGWTANPGSPQLPSAFTPISPDFEPYVPVVETLPASDVRPSIARLNGRADPQGQAAVGWFEWGTSPDYGHSTQHRGLGSGFGWTTLSENLTGLSFDQTYHFRFVASNAFTLVFGAEETLHIGPAVEILSREIPRPGQFRIQFAGVPGTEHEVLRSTDLSAWRPIGDGVESSAGLYEFLDIASPAQGGFYQVRSKGP